MSTVLTFLGAAGTAMGSRTLVEHPGTRTLVDCGLYQGERTWRRLSWEPFPVRASTIDGVVLTHTHLDHCGYLPASCTRPRMACPSPSRVAPRWSSSARVTSWGRRAPT